MESIILPPELLSSIGSEHKDFAVKARRDRPLKKILPQILFGMVFILVSSAMIYNFLSTLFSGGEYHYESNGVEVAATLNNPGSMIMPSIAIGIFAIVGLIVLVTGIISIFKEGPYFVGTPTRLVRFQNGILKSIAWEEFSGSIEVRGDTKKGNIELQMKTGKFVRSTNRRGIRSINQPDRFVHDCIDIAEIPNAFEIEQSCRKRIAENYTNVVNSEIDTEYM